MQVCIIIVIRAIHGQNFWVQLDPGTYAEFCCLSCSNYHASCTKTYVHPINWSNLIKQSHPDTESRHLFFVSSVLTAKVIFFWYIQKAT